MFTYQRRNVLGRFLWVELICLQYDVDSDEGAEKAEEFKVHSLIAMTNGCHRIGVPYYGISPGECARQSEDTWEGFIFNLQ